MLSQSTIDTVKSTAPALANHGLQITTDFYRRLFEHHPELKNVFNMNNQRNNDQKQALADAVFAYANNIDQLDILLPTVERIANKHASIGVEQHHYPIVGKHLLDAVMSVLQLDENSAEISAWKEAYALLANIFIDAEHKIYVDNVQKPNGWKGFKPYVIDKIVTETEEVNSLYLRPADGSNICGYKAGQYIGVKTHSKEHSIDEIRQYSLSDWGDQTHFRISVKSETLGSVSRQLHGFKTGQKLDISAPSGEFTLNDISKKQVYIAAGIGITPLISMLKYALANGTTPSNIVFIQCFRNHALQTFKNELQTLQKSFEFTYKTVVENDDPADWNGYIDRHALEEWQLDTSADVYFCGPIAFMTALNSLLKGIGFNDEQLHFETFGPTKSH